MLAARFFTCSPMWSYMGFSFCPQPKDPIRNGLGESCDSRRAPARGGARPMRRWRGAASADEAAGEALLDRAAIAARGLAEPARRDAGGPVERAHEVGE